MKIYIKTFGCTANKADSLYIKKKITCTGHTFTDNVSSAGIVIVNTCVVTHTTERKVLKFIQSLSGSDKRIIIAGCLPAARPGLLKGIDYGLITPSSLDNIIEMVGDGDMIDQPPVLEGVIGISSISRGCAGDCSYCIVKQARGELSSRPVPEITREIGLLLQQGAKEIQLASQDTAAYGLDIGVRLPELRLQSRSPTHPDARRRCFPGSSWQTAGCPETRCRSAREVSSPSHCGYRDHRSRSARAWDRRTAG